MDDTAIRLEGVTKAFGSHKVLDDITLDVRRKSGFCLLGRSGTGKSVTLKHIIGLMLPDRGRVLVEGRDVTTLKRRELADVRRRMGFLFQNAALFDSISVGENVAFPLRRHTDFDEKKIREVARAKLADVGLEKEYDKMPAESVRRHEEARRAGAGDGARPRHPPRGRTSAGLDPITSDEIDDLLVELKQRGTTIVMVTHNIPSARHVADDLAFLHEER
jgi:phospholipid/cholesterol/gamma-HCH transport system ATP-binding protein